MNRHVTKQLLDQGLTKIETQRQQASKYRQHMTNTAPAAYLSAESAAALDNRLRRLSVNFPRLVVAAHSERLALAGIYWRGQLSEIWHEFQRAGGIELAELVHRDRAAYGAAYVTVWADDSGLPTLTGDTPETMAVGRDPSSGSVVWAVRSWSTGDGYGVGKDHAVVYTPHMVEIWEAGSGTPAGANSWKHVGTVDNPLEQVPVVPFIRRESLGDGFSGHSALDDVIDLTDAVAKLLSDAMVTSEFHARPRRWATGLEIETDEDGRPIDPFSKGRLLQSEDPATRFGQLDGARLDGYSDLIATLTQQIGCLTGLPPHYLGLHGDQPTSSDSVKAAETQLVVAAYAAQRQLSRPWSTVAWLLEAVVAEGAAVAGNRRDWTVVWESPEIRTPAQQADAALKHRQIGVPMEYVLRHLLDYPADELDAIVTASRTDALLGWPSP